LIGEINSYPNKVQRFLSVSSHLRPSASEGKFYLICLVIVFNNLNSCS